MAEDSTAVHLPDALEAQFDRLEQVTRLGANWDSYGAEPIAPQAVAAAHRLITTVAEQFGAVAGDRVAPFTVAPRVDGGAQVEWRGPRREIEVEIGPAEDLGYLLIRKEAAKREFQEDDNVAWSEILGLITQILDQ